MKQLIIAGIPHWVEGGVALPIIAGGQFPLPNIGSVLKIGANLQVGTVFLTID